MPAPLALVNWKTSYRIIATRFPPRFLFERVAPDTDWDALEALADLTSPRVMQAEDRHGLFPPEECAEGEGAELVMAAFTYLNPEGSRFSDGSYGVYYTARSLDTAIHETVYHRRRFWRFSRLPAMHFPMKVLEARIQGRLHDLREKAPDRKLLDPDNYAASKRFALKVKVQEKAAGIVYPSVRHQGGECAAVFLPRMVSQCRRTMMLDYIWDGAGEVTVAKLDVMKVLKGEEQS